MKRHYHKLTPDQKRELITIYEAGTLNKAQLARSYNVRWQTVFNVLIEAKAKRPEFED